MSAHDNSSADFSRRRMLLRISLLAGALAGLHFVAGKAGWEIEMIMKPLHDQMGLPLLFIAVAVYILFMMLPFVPGLEIGLGIIMVFGTEGVIVVYFSTFAALTCSFLVGRLIPFAAVLRFLGWLHLERAQRLLQQVDPVRPAETLERVVRNAPARMLPFLLRHRYLAIALAFNLPGNALIGGGGGIGLMAGMSRMFRLDAYLLVVSIATSPVPIVLLTTSSVPMLFS